MIALNLPTYSFKVKNKENKVLIFDKIRKKYVVLTPEEWVRQHIVQYLHQEKKYPLSLIAIEKQIDLHQTKKRVDILVFNTNGQPTIIVECKAPQVPISQDSFDQIARYNLKVEAPYLMVSNGLNHYYCKLDHPNQTYQFLEQLPDYQ